MAGDTMFSNSDLNSTNSDIPESPGFLKEIKIYSP
jgi:hypothetical protein